MDADYERARDNALAKAPFLLHGRFDALRDGHQHSVVVVKPQDMNATPPPGIPRWPEPGEAFLSPQLLLDGAPEGIDNRYGRVAGTISPAGLSAADERLAWVHPLPGEFPLSEMDGYHHFGVTPEPWWSHERALFGETLAIYPAPFMLGVIILLGLFPSLLGARASAQIGWDERLRRSAVLASFGAPRSTSHLLRSGELLTPALVSFFAMSAMIALLVFFEIRLPVTNYLLPRAYLEHHVVELAIAGTAAWSAGLILLMIGGRRGRPDSVRPRPVERQFAWWPGSITPLGVAFAARVPYMIDPARNVAFQVTYLVGVMIALGGLPWFTAVSTAVAGGLLEPIAARRGYYSLLLPLRHVRLHPRVVVLPVAILAITMGLLLQAYLLTSTLGIRARTAIAIDQDLGGQVVVATYDHRPRSLDTLKHSSMAETRYLLVLKSPTGHLHAYGSCDAYARLSLPCPLTEQPLGTMPTLLAAASFEVPFRLNDTTMHRGDPSSIPYVDSPAWIVFVQPRGTWTPAQQSLVYSTTWPNLGPQSPGFGYAGTGFESAHQATWVTAFGVITLFALALGLAATGFGMVHEVIRALIPLGSLTGNVRPFVVVAGVIAGTPILFGGLVSVALAKLLIGIPVNAGLAPPLPSTVYIAVLVVCSIVSIAQTAVAARLIVDGVRVWRP